MNKYLAKKFCEDYQSAAKHLIRGVSDPLLHQMMVDFAKESHSSYIKDLQQALRDLGEENIKLEHKLKDALNGIFASEKAKWDSVKH